MQNIKKFVSQNTYTWAKGFGLWIRSTFCSDYRFSSALSLNENPRVKGPDFHFTSSASNTMLGANNNQSVFLE